MRARAPRDNLFPSEEEEEEEEEEVHRRAVASPGPFRSVFAVYSSRAGRRKKCAAMRNVSTVGRATYAGV